VIRVRILRSTVGDGGRVLAVGEVLFLADREAHELIALRKAEAVIADPSAPEPVHRDPAPTRTRGTRGKR
jgi:hypothetical protein